MADTITVGRIGAAYGVKGWVKLHSFTQPPENLFSYVPLSIKSKGGLKALEIEEFKAHAGTFIAKIVGVEQREALSSLRNVEVVVPRSALPELSEDDYYWHQLIGLRVLSIYEDKQYDLGCVESLMETGANDVLVVRKNPDGASSQVVQITDTTGDEISGVEAGEVDRVAKPVSEEVEPGERLIPYDLDHFVKRVDIDARCIWVEWDPNF